MLQSTELNGLSLGAAVMGVSHCMMLTDGESAAPRDDTQYVCTGLRDSGQKPRAIPRAWPSYHACFVYVCLRL